MKTNKYKAIPCVIDGIRFSSRHEANRYCALKLLEKAGMIQDLQLQVKFELIPAQYEFYERYGKNGNRLKDGKKCIEKECYYLADFVYLKDGANIVEDAKGMRTKDYIIKRKLMLYVHGIRIQEV